ncbi:MAG: hypothetical protein Q9213_001386 [Squamulea squamosa]
MFNIKKRLWKDKKKSHDEEDDDDDDERLSEAPSVSHRDPPPPPVATDVSDNRRASEPLANPVQRRPPLLEHLVSEPTALGHSSTFGLSERPRSRSADRRNDPLGLTTIHEPELPPPCDIIFIHGLGGTSRGTWAKGRDPDYFWPQKWLPFEPGIGHARILSFGYNASFAAAGPAPVTGIADFAKDLLHSMKYAKAGSLEELELGKFRHLAPRLTILSFYETLPTSVGPKKMVDPTQANQDSDYISVRNALKTLITDLCSTGREQLRVPGKTPSRTEEFESLLGVRENHQEDLDFFVKRWTTGTCSWILSHPTFKEWVRDGEGSPTMLWLHALPGSGKSILSSFIINHLLQESCCVYYFFRFGDQSKRSLSTCLRTTAYQLAEKLPQFHHALKEIRSSNKTLEKADPKTIWDKLFVDVLFKLRFPMTLYWIIDALDESDHPQLLINLMQDVVHTSAPIKILLISRQNDDLLSTFDRLSEVVSSVYLPFENTKKDIRTYVENEMQYMRAPQKFKSLIIEKLVAGASGNFLWASLALVEVMRCNTREDLDRTLETIPSGMEQLYKRMESSIISKTKDRPQDRRLGHTILTWAACSRRPLVLAELAQALQPEFSVMLDLQFAISRVCGQFVVIDASDRLVMVHQTARDHITTTQSDLAVHPTEAHEGLFTKCLSILEERPQRRGSSRRVGDQEFVRYATTSWAYHLNLTSVKSDEPLLQLAKFLTEGSVLAWIVLLAQQNQLKVLVYSSKIMTLYVRRKRGRYGSTNPLLHRLQELDLIESWATDLLKILGKFGQNLMSSPMSIYQQIPPFCPKSSMIYRYFEQQTPYPPPLQVGGVTQNVWDDSLAKISLGPRTQTLAILCSGPQFAVLTGTGDVNIYDSTTFELQRTLSHEERVCAMCFSDCSELLATYGFRTTKVWSVRTGHIAYQIRNPLGSRAFTITFAADDSELVIGSNDRLLRVTKLTATNPAWSVLHDDLLKQNRSTGGPLYNVPWRIVFNSTASCVAVAYRDSPLCVWSLDPPELLGRCMRNQEYTGKAWTVVDQMIWHPHSEEIIGLYQGGHVFRWNPWDDTQQELQANGSILASSPEGKFFAIGDSNGTIKLYNFDHFTLIYQLFCENLINDMCFGPDSKRLYDLRGQFCNVWGPNALMRADESVENESDVVSEVVSVPTAAISEAVAEVRDQITAIGTQPTGPYQAIGNDTGVVSLIDSTEGDCTPFRFCGSDVPLSITHLAWSGDGNYLAYAELTGKVIVRKVQLDNHGDLSVPPTFDVKLQVSHEGIKQILLDREGDRLLVRNGPTVTIWSSEQNTSTQNDGTSTTLPDTEWIQHPKDSSLLLAFSCSQMRVFRWDDLSEVAAFGMPNLFAPSDTRTSGKTDEFDGHYQVRRVGGIYTNPSGSHLLVDLMQATDSGQQLFTCIIQTSTLIPQYTESNLPLTHIPPIIQRQIEIPLGLLPKQRIIFLDKDYWMCSWRVGGNPTTEKVQRYYCLPKDWLNVECLKLHEAQRWLAVASGTMPTSFPPLIASRENVAKKKKITRTYRSVISFHDLHEAARRHDALLTTIPTYAWVKLLKVYTGSKDDLVFDYILSQHPGTADNSLPFPRICSFNPVEKGSLTLGHAIHEFSGHLTRNQDQQRTNVNRTTGTEDGGRKDHQHLGTLLDLGRLSESFPDRGVREDTPHDLTKYVISLSVQVPEVSNGRLSLELIGRGDVINQEAAQLLLAQYDLLLKILVRYPDKSVYDIFTHFSLPLLSIANPQTVASIPFPSLQSQFETVAKANPQEIALEFWTTEPSTLLRPATIWTYAELDRRAEAVAAELQSRFGSLTGCIVPICMDRCPEIYATILGILKAGAAWCPIDPSFPLQRRHDLIARTNAKALVLNSRSPQDGIPKGVVVVELSLVDWSSPGLFKSPHINPDSLAYLIWTSGTTGAPKGVPISHRAATISMTALQACIPRDVKPDHVRCLQFSQFTFDVFVQDLFYTWGAGGTLVSADRNTMLGSFSDLATKSRATHAHLTPSFAASVPRKQCPTLEVVTMIGEKLTQNVADDWSEDCRLYNTYGPAEATVVATFRLVPHGDVVKSANVGVPMPSVSAFVIHDGEVTVKNGIGELALGGPQLFGGYWDDYSKTKERFVWNDQLQTTLYMTGDIVRQLFDGTLDFVGRTDDLIKVQGIRVELSEIAYSLRSCHSDVRQVEVFFLSRPDRPSKVIVAFLAIPTLGNRHHGIIVDDHGIEVAQKAREVAKTQLPDYMIPSIFLIVADIPRTSSAKVDQLAIEHLYATFDLGAWEERLGPMATNGAMVAALHPYEIVVVEIISNITGTSKEAMSRQSTLPSIGVNSITATRLAAQLRFQGYAISVADIMQCSKLEDLFQSSRTGELDIARKVFDAPAFHQHVIAFLDQDLARHVEVVLPAMPLQESLLSESFQDPSAYWSHKLYELDTNIDLKRLQRAWVKVAQSTDALRATFLPVADVAHQLQAKTTFLQLVHVSKPIDWSTVSSSESVFETRAKDRAREIAERSQANRFAEPLWAVTIISVSSRNIMMLSIHHAIRDEPSLAIIMNDVEHAYIENAATSSLQQRRQLRDAVTFLFVADLDLIKRHEQFWSNSVLGFSDRDEPKTWPELKLADDGRMKGTVSYCWDAKKSYRNLHAESVNIGVASLASVLRVVWGCMLLEYLETDKVVYGETWTARGEAPELSDLVAPLVSVLPVPFQADGTWREALQSTTNFQQQSRAHNGVHPSSIRKMMNRSEGEALYPAIFNFVPFPAEVTSNGTSLLWRELDDVVELSFEHSIALNAAVSHDDTLRFELTALKSCIDREHLHVLAMQIDALLQIILDNPDLPCSQLFDQMPRSLISVEPLEEKSINHAWKESPTEWVDHYAATHPTWYAAEVVSSLNEHGVISQRWSYEQLQKAYRNVARFISEAGCRQRTIGVCLERCLDVYAVVLGIMCTGNIYLPIADDLPEERKIYLVKDSDAAMLFTSKSFSSALSTTCRTIFVEDLDYSNTISDPWTVLLSPTDDAYLLYTSGSTGFPKGVLVSRGNLTSFIEAISQFICLHVDMVPLQGKGKWIGMASYAFDVHLLEIFFAWRHGMATVTAARSMLLDNLELALQQLKVTHASFVPSLVDNAGLEPARLPDLRYMSLGGEKISKRAIDTWSRSHVVLANAYGPTEATIGCCFRRVESTNNARNIGYPLPYTVAHVLRPGRTEYVLRGTSGELCLTGDLVATGYLNRPEAKGFVEDFHGRRMYRTGDHVRLMSDGSLEFLGRQDDQTKIRGQRIELGEVCEVVRSAAKRLLNNDLVEVASLVIQHPALTRPQLVSFVSTQGGSRNTVDKTIARINFPNSEVVEDIRIHCRRTLPSFMIPDHLIRLKSLPLVPTSRKVDMKRLGSLFKSISLIELTSSGKPVSTTAHTPSKTELSVRRVVSDVLELAQLEVDANSNLFKYGLDSLNVISLTVKLQKEGLGCTVSKLLQNPTIRAISEGLTQRESIQQTTDWPTRLTDLERNFKRQSSSVNLINIAAIRPCLPLQETLVASSLDNGGEALYVNHVLLELSPEVDHQRLIEAWTKTAVDNEVLRTCFCGFENHFVQLVLKVAPLSCDHMYTDAADHGELDLHQRRPDITSDIIAGIEIRPPVKLTLASRRWPGRKGLLLVSLHHALYDADSFSMLLDEVYANYQGIQSLVARTPITTIIKYIESRSQSDARMFWTKYLAGYSPPSKPQSTAKGESNSLIREMVTPLAELERFATSMNGTLASMMQALVGIVLAERAQTQDLVFGTILSGRTVPVENPHTILAPCITTIPQRVLIDCASNLRSIVSFAQKGFIESIEHQHTALRDIHRWVKAETPLFDSLFTYTKKYGKASWSHLWNEVESSMSTGFPLTVEVVADQVMNRVIVRWDFMTTSETRESIISLAESLQFLLESLVQGHDLTLDAPLAKKSEEQSLDTLDDHQLLGDEILMKEIISSVVGIDARSISRDTAFFALGLDSIVAIQFAKRLRQHGIQCSSADVMRHSSIAKLGHHIAMRKISAPSTTSGSIQPLRRVESDKDSIADNALRFYPCTPLQSSMLTQTLGSDASLYVHHRAIRFTEDSRRGLRKAWEDVVSTTEILRTSFQFSQEDHTWLGLIHERPQLTWIEHEASMNLEQVMTQIKGRMMFREERDLANPPWQVDIIDDVFILSLHHSLYDGESIRLLFQDFWASWKGTRLPKRPLFSQAAEETNRTKGEAKDFWVSKLTSFRGIPRGSVAGPVRKARARLNVSPTVLLEGSKRLGVTIQSVALLAFGKTIAWLSRRQDIVFGHVVSGRSLATIIDADEVVGPMFNTVPVRVRLSESSFTNIDVVQDIQKMTGESQTYQHASLGKVQQAWREKFNNPEAVLLDSLFVFQRRATSNGDQFWESVALDDTVAPTEYATNFECEQADTGMFVSANSSSIKDLDFLIRTFESMLYDIVESPDRPVNGVLSEALPLDTNLLYQSPGSTISGKSGRQHVDVEPDTLETVQRLLAKVLGTATKNIASSASIFSLGLDSISAIQIAAEARKEGVQLSVADVLQGRSVIGISERLEQSQNKRLAAGGQAISKFTDHSLQPAHDPLPLPMANGIKSKDVALAGLRVDDVEDVLPCLAGQYFQLMTWLKSGRTQGEGTFTYRCKDPLDPHHLLSAWRTLRERHSILRTVFVSISATKLMQAVLKPAAVKSDAFQCIDYGPSTDTTIGTVVKQIAARRFDVFSPPVELSLARCSAGYDRLVLKLHHALYDAWTIGKLVDELGALYEGKTLSPVPCSTWMIQDIIRSSVAGSSQDYWRKTLAGCQATMFISASQPVPAVHESYGRSCGGFFFLHKAIPDLHQLECRCQQSGASLPRVILLAFGRWLAKLTGVKSPTFGLYHTGRSWLVEDLNKSCLPCMNMMPLMVREPLTRGIRSSVEDLETDLAARVPFEQSNLYDVFEWIGWGWNPLFNTFVNILWRHEEADTRPQKNGPEAPFLPWEAGKVEDITPSLRLPGRSGVDGLDTSLLADGNLFFDVQRYDSQDELRLSVRCDFEVSSKEETKVVLERIVEEIRRCVKEVVGEENGGLG